MCGRFNLGPAQWAPAVIAHEGKNRIGQMKWGLIPPWAKDDKMAYKTFNAVDETVDTKATYKRPFQSKRCLVPVDGFYEWKELNLKPKQPYRILMKSGEIFSLAGIWDTWINPEGVKIHSFSVITTTPNDLMKEIHNRMPVILRKEDEAEWLDLEANVQQLKLLLRPYDTEEMRAYPVGQGVGNVRNQGAELVEEVK